MRESARILVVDDEEDLRQGLAETLQGEGHQVETAAEGWGALEQARALRFDLALVDLKMPGMDGMVVLDQLKQLSPETLVVMITGHATVESAVAAMKLGAYDYLTKPFKLEQVRLVVRRAVEQKRLADENRRLRQEVEHYQRFEQIVGKSACMQELYRAIEKAAPTNSTVLIAGETGTGKDLVARALHQRSPRAQGPLVSISCGAIPESLLESELFGHVRGAFTGAHADREGVFEAAEGGTLFLDEIGDLPLDSQRVLLQVLQDGTFQRVGGQHNLRVDVRVLAATNRDLKQAMSKGQFREDLFYRLSPFVLHLPPLRQRREDIPLLVHYFAEQFARHLNRPTPAIDPRVLDALALYHWPGNVRELEHLVQRALLVCRDHHIRLEDLPALDLRSAAAPAPLSGDFLPLDEQERQTLVRALRTCNWIVYGERGAAQLLGIHPERLRAKMRKYGLRRPLAAAGRTAG